MIGLSLILFKSFHHFKVDGNAFLGLTYDDSTGDVHILGVALENYGRWQGVKSFKKYFKTEGTKLALDEGHTGGK